VESDEREVHMLTGERLIVREAARYWWVFLVTGVTWLIVAWVAELAPFTLSRWRHGFKSRWDYERKLQVRALGLNRSLVEPRLRPRISRKYPAPDRA
jgi:hypothetical protein